MKTYLVITALLLGAFSVTSCGDSDRSGDPSPLGTADPPSVTERWKGLTRDERDAVCAQASAPPSPPGQISQDGPDYRGMLSALMETGLKQEDASAMLPYVVSQC